jgi:hypothetical protein
MANLWANITPTGLTQKHEVTLWYQLFQSIWAICDKLDDDATVPLTTYEANVFTALFNASIDDGLGNSIMNHASEENFYTVMPTGITDAARLQMIYQFFNMLETLTEQLDTDTIDTSNYEALCYIAIMLQLVEDTKGNILGNLAADIDLIFYFRPGGVPKYQLVQFFYNAVLALETLTEKLDVDALTTPPTDTNYEALCYTAIILTRVEDGKGNVVGNTYPQG